MAVRRGRTRMPPCALEVDRRTAGLYTNIDRRLFILNCIHIKQFN